MVEQKVMSCNDTHPITIFSLVSNEKDPVLDLQVLCIASSRHVPSIN